MIKRRIRPNCTTGIDKSVKFIEEWFIEFPHLIIMLRVNYIYEDGTVRKRH